MFTCGLTFFVVAVIGAVTGDMKMLAGSAGLTVLFGAITAWVAPARQSASGSQRPCEGCGNEWGFHEKHCTSYRWH